MGANDSAISKAVAILHLLANDINRLSDIKKHLGFSNSTTHRLLKNLESTGIIVQDPITKHYFLGNDIIKWASKESISHHNLVLSASTELEHLHRFSGETVFICKRVGTQKLVIEELPSDFTIKLTYGKGFGSPVYTGATGRALLSLLDEYELSQFFNNIQLVPATAKTIIDKETLLAEIQRVKINGYAISYGEASPESAAISVPLQDGTGLFALTVVGPENRFNPEKVISKVLNSADKILKSYHRSK